LDLIFRGGNSKSPWEGVRTSGGRRGSSSGQEMLFLVIGER
jgi:hypothetical protein